MPLGADYPVGAGNTLVVPIDGEGVLRVGGAGMRNSRRPHRPVQGDAVVTPCGDQGTGVGIAGVHPVLAGRQVPLGQAGMDDSGHLVIRHRGDGGGHVRDQMHRVRITGLGHVDLVAVPAHLPLGPAAGLGVIRADQARRARRPVFWATARHLAIDQVEVLDPHLPQKALHELDPALLRCRPAGAGAGRPVPAPQRCQPAQTSASSAGTVVARPSSLRATTDLFASMPVIAGS